MRKPLIGAFLIVLALAGVLLFLFLWPGRTPKPPAEAPPSFYVQLIEENQDTFPELLALFSARALPEPFAYRDGKIVVDSGVAEAISKGEARERYGLWEHPPRLDLSKPLLFVEHEIKFLGVGREWGTSRYAIFEKFPAAVSLDPYEDDSKEIRLPLINSLEVLGKIRSVGPALEILKGPQGMVDGTEFQIRYQGRSYELKPGGELSLGTETRAIRVLQEFTAPVPLGPVKPEEIRTETQDWGEVTFSTSLRLRLEKPAPASLWTKKKE